MLTTEERMIEDRSVVLETEHRALREGESAAKGQLLRRR